MKLNAVDAKSRRRKDRSAHAMSSTSNARNHKPSEKSKISPQYQIRSRTIRRAS